MRHSIFNVLTLVSIAVLSSCNLTDDKEPKTQQYMEQRVTSESGGALRLDNFKKINGMEQEMMGAKIYILEWQANISTLKEIWKGGNGLVGYWQGFSVMTQQPGFWEAYTAGGGVKHFLAGANVQLTGDCQLKKTDNGWEVSQFSIKTSQILSEGNQSQTQDNNKQADNAKDDEISGDAQAPITLPISSNNSTTSNTRFAGKYPQGSQRLLTNSDISGMNKKDLKIMRNEIFARHGYIFKTADMKNYFDAQNGYKAQYSDVTNQLSQIEKVNVEFIKQYEK